MLLIADLPVITYSKGESLRELSRHVVDGQGHLVEVCHHLSLPGPSRLAVIALRELPYGMQVAIKC